MHNSYGSLRNAQFVQLFLNIIKILPAVPEKAAFTNKCEGFRAVIEFIHSCNCRSDKKS